MFSLLDALGDVHWLGVVVATVATTVLGGVWYVVVVPKPYAVALGREGAPAPESSVVTNLGPIVCGLITVVASAVLVEALDITAMGDALGFGALVGVGYLTAMTFQIAINPNVPRPLLYGVVNAPYFVVGSLATSAILVAMR